MKYSVHIPQIQKKITKNRISSVLNDHVLGTIEKIDLVSVNSKYNMAFIHFSEWNVHIPVAQKIKTNLDNGSYCQIYVANTNEYWKLLKNKSSKNNRSTSNQLTVRKILPSPQNNKSTLTDFIKIEFAFDLTASFFPLLKLKLGLF